jgi:hypothetical protein
MRMVNNEKTSRASVPRPKGDQSVLIVRTDLSTRGPSENPTTLVNILRGRYPRRVGAGRKRGLGKKNIWRGREQSFKSKQLVNSR